MFGMQMAMEAVSSWGLSCASCYEFPQEYVGAEGGVHSAAQVHNYLLCCILNTVTFAWFLVFLDLVYSCMFSELLLQGTFEQGLFKGLYNNIFDKR